jgi:hypothetical protein
VLFRTCDLKVTDGLSQPTHTSVRSVNDAGTITMPLGLP